MPEPEQRALVSHGALLVSGPMAASAQDAMGNARLQSNNAGSVPWPRASNMLSLNAISRSEAAMAFSTRRAATASRIARWHASVRPSPASGRTLL